MKWWIKFGCFITGWNSNILATCSEASYKALKKYTASLLILIILWGFIGFCFAERYVQAPWWGCVIAALIAVTIIIQIERQIILTVGTNKWLSVIRIIIAVIMAVIGSAILDQIIFKDDLEQKKVEMRTDKVNEIAPKRQKSLQLDIERITNNINQLDSINEKLNEEIAKRPTITAQNKTVSTGKGVNANGIIESIKGQSVSTINLANPRIRQVETNNKELERLNKELEKKSDKRALIEEDVRKELEKHNGFLEELEALVKILSSSGYALGFWLILFFFLMSLELFVLFGKIGDRESDYDMVIKHQLEVRRRSLQKVLDNEIKDK